MKNPDFDRVIIISQPIHEEIPEKVMLSALPDELKDLPRELVEFKPSQMKHRGGKINWRDSQMKQRLIFETELEPLLDDSSHDLLVYFGLAPIPLMIHLGYLIGPLKTNVLVFQKLHDKPTDDVSSWALPDSIRGVPIPAFEQVVMERPDHEINVGGKAILRVESSFPRILMEDCLSHVPKPLGQTYIAHLNRDKAFRKDPFSKEEEIHQAAKLFSQELDHLHLKLHSMEEIHLFAAVQPAVAFLMGKEIYQTTNKPIYCYHYNTENSLGYERAFLLQDTGVISVGINEEDRIQIAELRKKIAGDLEGKLHPFAKSMTESDGKNWFEILDTNVDPWKPAFSKRDLQWGALSAIGANRFLTEFPVALEGFDQTKRGFYDSSQQHWTLSDRMIYLASQRIPEEEDLLRAFRLFFFHEAVHNVDHGITPHTSRNLGSFPDVLAEADYQADVYSFIHEYHLAIRNKDPKAENPQLFFADLILLCTKMMWAFDAAEYELELEARRIRRYLALYFQLLKMQHHGCKDLYSVLEVLNRRPSIDLFGLQTTLSKNRPVSILVEGQGSNIVLAVWHDRVVKRIGSVDGLFDPETLVRGFRERNGDLVLEALKGIVDTVLT